MQNPSCQSDFPLPVGCHGAILHTWQFSMLGSATEVQFRTAPNPVRTANRTRSLVPVPNLAELEPRVRFGRTGTTGPVWGSANPGSAERFENAVQTRSNGPGSYLIFLIFHSPALTFHSIFGATHSTPVSCDMINKQLLFVFLLQHTTTIKLQDKTVS